ncbi:MAG: signal recognition particle-docking protein FtsY [Nanoarchaeota archaeon]
MFKFLKDKLSQWKDALTKKKKEVKEIPKKTKIKEKKLKKEAKQKEKKTKQPKVEEIQEVPAAQEEIVFPEKVEQELDSEIEHKHIEFEEAEEKQAEQIKEIIEKSEEKKGFFSRLKEKATTIEFTNEEFESQFENLELILMESNVALEAIDFIKFKLKQKIVNRRFLKKEIDNLVKETLRDSLNELLITPFNLMEKIKSSEKPFIILFFGINGTGKTTTIAKLAYLLKQNKISSVIVAGDTFRAASIEQLEIHGKKLDIPVIKHPYGSDPASVGFDAIQHAKSHNIDVVLIDTAGRMHTKANLLKEMEFPLYYDEIAKIIKKLKLKIK